MELAALILLFAIWVVLQVICLILFRWLVVIWFMDKSSIPRSSNKLFTAEVLEVYRIYLNNPHGFIWLPYTVKVPNYPFDVWVSCYWWQMRFYSYEDQDAADAINEKLTIYDRILLSVIFRSIVLGIKINTRKTFREHVKLP